MMLSRWKLHRGLGLRGKKTMPEQVQGYRRRLTAKQKDERQDNRDRRRLARQHPSDLLRSLTRGPDRRSLDSTRRLDCASRLQPSPFRPSTCSA